MAKKNESKKTRSAKSTTDKGKALLAEAKKVLAAGEPLGVKQRKEVIVRFIRSNPAFVAAAAAAYEEHAALLGDDLDPKAALEAQAFAIEMTPVATQATLLAKSLEDRILERRATAASFAATVHERLAAMAKLPQGASLASRVAQLDALRTRPARKKKSEAPPPNPKAA